MSWSRFDACCLHFMWEASNAFFSNSNFVMLKKFLPYVFFRGEKLFEVSESSFPFCTGDSVFLLAAHVGVVWHMSPPRFECELGFSRMLGLLPSHVLFLTLPFVPSLRVAFGMSCHHLRFDGICVSNRPCGGVTATCVVDGECGIGWPRAWWKHS